MKPKSKRGRPKKSTALVPVEKKDYFISITLGDRVFTGKGATVLEALESMPVPVKIISKGLVVLQHEDKEIQKMYQPPSIKRLFYPNARYVVAKQLQFLLK